MAPDWTLLPVDLLGIIALKSETFEDFFYFSAVCRRWNHAWSSVKRHWRATPVPWLLLTENTDQNPNHLRKIFNLANNKCYELNLPETFGTRCWGSPYGWVVMVSRDFSIRLFNPLTKAQICLPSLETFPNPPQPSDCGLEDYPHWCLFYFLTKLILLKVSQGSADEFVIMALYNSNECLAFARHGDQSWTSIYVNVDVKSEKIADIVAMEDRIFALYKDGAIQYWNATEFSNFEFGKPTHYSSGGCLILRRLKRVVSNLYLVQSGRDLLVVIRYKDDQFKSTDPVEYHDVVYETDGFTVCKVNHENGSWNKIEDVGEVALFVGNNSSMSVTTVQAKCLLRNCIYFTDDENECWMMPKKFGGHDMGVYDINCNKIWRFYEGVDMHSTFCTPLWFIPQLQ